MANIPQFPGVIANELDNTFLSPTPTKVGAAIVGPTVKGIIEVPTIVTSYSDYENRFGSSFVSGSDNYSFLTSIAAYNYFNNGGKSLLVTRVVSGSYSSATGSIENGDATSAFVLETISQGVIMNSSSSLNVDGSLPLGTKDNVRWEIKNANTGSGTFTLLIRRGDDKTNSTNILETFSNLSLDPTSNRYISRVIGDQNTSYNPTTNQLESTGNFPNASRYIRVKSVDTPTPNYIQNDGTPNSSLTGSIPVNGIGAFDGAVGDIKGGANFYDAINNSNTQGLVAGNYDNMINLLSNKNAYQFNLLVTPGLIDNLASHTSKISTIITNTQNRGDNVYLMDLTDADATINETLDQASTRNSSYVASYFPWVQVIDPSTGKRVWVPASTVVIGTYAFTERLGVKGVAPAGKKRGVLNVLKPKVMLSDTDRENLYNGKVNPIITLPNTGVTVYGQKTLQTGSSALDRVNVRLLMIELKNYISQLADNLTFEQNVAATRNAFIAQVTPYLESMQQKHGLYAFKVIMDDTNNTGDIIDRNQLVGQFYIQPSRSVEFISLDFILTPTGTAFPV